MQTKMIGIIVLVLGVLMMIYTGITYNTTKEVGNIGNLEITKTEAHPIHWSPIIGVILIVAGIVLMATSKKTT